MGARRKFKETHRAERRVLGKPISTDYLWGDPSHKFGGAEVTVLPPLNAWSISELILDDFEEHFL